MPDQKPTTVFLKNYLPPEYLVEKVDLYFRLGEAETRVTSTLQCHRNPERESAAQSPLLLDGEAELVSISMDGNELGTEAYSLSDTSLTIHVVPEHFELSVETRLYPDKNTSLEGLYRSNGNFCTQC